MKQIKKKWFSNTVIQSAVYPILALLIKGIHEWLSSACPIMAGTPDGKQDANLSQQAQLCLQADHGSHPSLSCR